MRVSNIKLTVAALVVVPALLIQSPRLTESTVDVKVNRTSTKLDQYLVYTDKDTYEVEDSWAYFNFFPDEDWGRIKEGSCYRLTTIGFRVRVPIVGWNNYKNVVDSEETQCVN